MGVLIYGIIGLNIAYWVFMENVLRTKDAKEVGFDSTDNKNVPKKEFGNTSAYITVSQLIVYIVPIVLRKMGVSYVKISGFHGHEVTPLALGAVGATLFAFALRYYAMSTLGKFFSRRLGIQGKHEIVRNGPYAVVRNPGYSANLILFLVYALAVSGDLAVGLAIWLQWMFVMLAIRIKGEEEMLLTDPSTGEEYKKYMQDVKYKLIPFVV